MNNRKKSVTIIANGQFPFHDIPLTILSNTEFIISCDGATDSLLKKGYKPNLIIGDLDSISEKSRKLYKEKIILNSNQSENDLRKAINHSIELGFKKINIVGATGLREDHTIGNIFSIIKYPESDIKIYTDSGLFRVIKDNQSVKSFQGQQISIFSPDNTIKITTSGLKYNINKNTLSTLFYGTLNESLKQKISFKLSHGNIMIFQKF